MLISTSAAGTRPLPSLRGTSRRHTTACERGREQRTDLLVLVRRIEGDDPVDGLGRVGGVQGREDQVAGVGRLERHVQGFHVADLTDQDHVGVLPQHVAQRRAERERVAADLALGDVGR